MEKVNFNYSLKNIHIPSNNLYLKTLIDKVSSLIRRMRRKAYFFDNPDQKHESNNNNFGFRSEYSLPQSAALIPIENDMYELIPNVLFKRCSNNFQTQLTSDIKSIQHSKNLLTPADKTTNLYKVMPQQYGKLLAENITKTYKKSGRNTVLQENREAKDTAKSLNLDDRIEGYPEKSAFITFKDHKDGFQNNPKCRLMNLAKSETGKVSKKILDSINSQVREKTDLIQWRNTSEVINWFKQIDNKNKKCFSNLISLNFTLLSIKNFCLMLSNLQRHILPSQMNSKTSYCIVVNLSCSTIKMIGPNKRTLILMLQWVALTERKFAN